MGNEVEVLTCECCGVVFDDENEPNSTFDGDVCQNCLEDEYFWCEESEEYHHADNCIEVFYRDSRGNTQPRYISDRFEHRYTRTVNGDLWHDDDVTCLQNGDFISPDDWENGYYTSCGSCNDVLDSDDMRYDEEDDMYLCPHCYANRQPTNRLIYEWDYAPEPIFHGDSELFTFGTELEFDAARGEYISTSCREQIAEKVYEIFDSLLYNKKDGSIRHGGFEIVSHPATYEYLYSRKQDFKTLFEYIVSKGGRSHDSQSDCGLHIHISRDYFKSTLHRDAFTYLFEKFYEQIFKFSRRTREQANQWAESYGIFEDTMSLRTFADKLANAYKRKYRVVNYLKSATLECRIFKGSLNVDTYFASLQFMRVIADIANSIDLVVHGVTWQSIVKLARLRGYTELVAYLVKRGLDTVKTPRSIVLVRKERMIPRFSKLYVVGSEGAIISHCCELGEEVELLRAEYDEHYCVYSQALGREQYIHESELSFRGMQDDNYRQFTLDRFDITLDYN